jgi:hypothetical protein
VIALLVVVVFGLTHKDSSSKPAAPPTASEFFGVDAVNMLRDEEEAPEFETLGVKTVRINLEYGSVEAPGSGGCEETPKLDWSHYDEVFRRAAEHGLTLLVDLYGNRAVCGDGNWFPVPGTKNFEAFTGGLVTQAVARYGPEGKFWSENPELPYLPANVWEVWNEPNLPENNSGEEVDPQAYAQLLIAASESIHGVDPSATVLTGGIYLGAGRPLAGYLASIYGEPDGYQPAQFHEAFQGLAIHPYATTGYGAELAFGGPEVSEGRTEEARQVLGESRASLGGASDAEKSLWVTEVGWPTEFGVTASTAAITPERQASDAIETLEWMQDHADELDISFAALFSARDYNSQSGCTEAECWPMYAGMKRIEFLGPQPHYVDRPLRCAFKGLLDGEGCPGWRYQAVGSGSDPAIASAGIGSLELFDRDSHHRLQRRSWSMGGGWTGWEAMPGVGQVDSPPAAVSGGPIGPRVAARLADGSVGLWTEQKGTWSEQPLGGLTTGRPALSSSGNSRTDVFARGEDPFLFHVVVEPGVPVASTWELLPGPPATSDPSAASLAPGVLDVVARTSSTAIGHWHYEANVWSFEEIAAPEGSAPTIVAPSPERLDVFFTGKRGILHATSEAGSHWSSWELIPGKIPGTAPAAVAWSPNRIDLAGSFEGGGIGHWYLEW